MHERKAISIYAAVRLFGASVWAQNATDQKKCLPHVIPPEYMNLQTDQIGTRTEGTCMKEVFDPSRPRIPATARWAIRRVRKPNDPRS